jgi:alpha-glucosidase
MVDPVETLVPPGVWYDYWTGARLAGAPPKKVPALGELTVLVRGGAIVPHAPLVQSTSETPKGPLELRVYPGPACKGSVYLDDGDTFDYQRGAFLRLAATCEETPGAVTVKTAAAEGAYTPWFTAVTFSIHGAPSAPKAVTVAGKATREFKYDATKKVVTVTTPYAKSGHVVTIAY